MIRRHALTLITLAAFAPWSSAGAGGSEPINLGVLKQEVTAYKTSGAYARDFAAVVRKAAAYVKERATSGGKLAIVLDIDETSLSNWPTLKATDFGYMPELWNAWVDKAAAEALPPTLELYKATRAADVAVFFITGRRERHRNATRRNLESAGYRGWAGLVLKPNAATYDSAADYKAPERCKLEVEGWVIILNMGDQPSDLEGGCAERAFLLPNPFYRIP